MCPLEISSSTYCNDYRTSNFCDYRPFISISFNDLEEILKTLDIPPSIFKNEYTKYIGLLASKLGKDGKFVIEYHEKKSSQNEKHIINLDINKVRNGKPKSIYRGPIIIENGNNNSCNLWKISGKQILQYIPRENVVLIIPMIFSAFDELELSTNHYLFGFFGIKIPEELTKFILDIRGTYKEVNLTLQISYTPTAITNNGSLKVTRANFDFGIEARRDEEYIKYGISISPTISVYNKEDMSIGYSIKYYHSLDDRKPPIDLNTNDKIFSTMNNKETIISSMKSKLEFIREDFSSTKLDNIIKSFISQLLQT